MKALIGLTIVGMLAITATFSIHERTEWEEICDDLDNGLSQGFYIGEEAKAARLLLDVCIDKQRRGQ